MTGDTGGRGLAGTAAEGEEGEEGEVGEEGLGTEGGGREMVTSDMMEVCLSVSQWKAPSILIVTHLEKEDQIFS